MAEDFTERNWKVSGFQPSQQYPRIAPAQKIVAELSSLLSQHQTAKSIYNDYADIRNTAAEISELYLKGVSLEGKIDEAKLRYLLIRGCDKVMDGYLDELLEIEKKLYDVEDKLKHLQ